MTTLWAPANGRRTVSVRVRSLLLGTVVVVAVAGAVLGARWLDGFTPIAVGSSSGGGPHATAIEPANGSGGVTDGLIRILGLRLPADPQVISWSDTVPFRPITLHAGTELQVIVLLRMGNCRFNGYGGSASIDSLPIRYTLFGVLHRTEEFPAGSAVSVAAPRASACPER